MAQDQRQHQSELTEFVSAGIKRPAGRPIDNPQGVPGPRTVISTCSLVIGVMTRTVSGLITSRAQPGASRSAEAAMSVRRLTCLTTGSPSFFALRSLQGKCKAIPSIRACLRPVPTVTANQKVTHRTLSPQCVFNCSRDPGRDSELETSGHQLLKNVAIAHNNVVGHG
jgi:hypothetical protein